MNLLSVENLTKFYGELCLFKDISFGIDQGQKIALVARNGSGKSTLFKILMKREPADEGSVVFRKETRVAFLDQDELFDPNITVKAALLSGNHPGLEALEEYQLAVLKEDNARIEELSQKVDELNAWDAEARAIAIADNLGLSPIFDRKCGKLSGGQLKRLSLAKTLVSEPDLLMLDEPTNHLDLNMIEWLERYLSQSNITVFLVTHDRFFLDRVCDEIIELRDQSLLRFKGNYGYYLEKKQEQEDQLIATTEKAKNLYKRELEWIRRMPKARGTKAKSRVDAFSETKKKAHVKLKKEQVALEVKSERLGTKTVELHKISKTLGDKPILNKFSYLFKRGEKIGLVGKNGMGKSTLLNIITGSLKPDSGKVIIGDTVKFGYYTQKGLDVADDIKVIDAIKDIAEIIPLEGGKKLTASQMLERFLFSPKKQYQLVGTLSGGEKKRLQLLRVLMTNPNFLILDEPTNDLDIETLQVLEDFLLEYKGCVVVVTHDRFFLDKIVDHLFVYLKPGEIKDFPGNYSQFRIWEKENVLSETKEQVEPNKPKEQESINTVPSVEKKKLSYNEQREFGLLEEEIEKLEQKKLDLTEKLESGESDHEKLMKWGQELTEITNTIDEKTMRWLELSERA
ncbi:ABC-F family ATP-binding cassette domain-containing protein [Luteibaculum oceani]|uniref:ABC-F family ATP-binding cassette domain-containing protein n=1 Tax=Luteibaculum oceani TaxID=1294296 RepID=A0A5C6UYH4_9FLAO|nr:ABC-F family ATP-binding cassette domain-containing protein [Luteibaculum oceani]TXC78472.1 ABC-F family ATP-binding cassette domain-containing protein [Luteibaculum oceani]